MTHPHLCENWKVWVDEVSAYKLEKETLADIARAKEVVYIKTGRHYALASVKQRRTDVEAACQRSVKKLASNSNAGLALVFQFLPWYKNCSFIMV